jgi:hypothetical protein
MSERSDLDSEIAQEEIAHLLETQPDNVSLPDVLKGDEPAIDLGDLEPDKFDDRHGAGDVYRGQGGNDGV